MLAYVGILLVIFIGYKFFIAIGKKLPIMELMMLIAGLQWIVGPTLEYASETHNIKYYMYVTEDVYMAYVVPAYAFFVALIYYPIKKYTVDVNIIYEFNRFSKYGVTILMIGLVADNIGGILPGALAFFAFLLSGFKYVGAIILFFSNNKKHRYIFYAAILVLMFSAFRKALFHDFILWSVFFFMFWALKAKPSSKMKLILMGSGLFFLTVIQTIKAEYRMRLDEESGNFVEILFGTITNAYSDSGDLVNEVDSEDEQNLNVRLNQGWIISAIMDHVPRNRPFAGGATIFEAVTASLVPRIINPNKKEAGGQENFREFTGLYISDDTSMGLSIIGEFYANFGVGLGIFMMGVWGYFLALVWRKIIKMTYTIPLLIFFIPLIFLQVVKAETELVVVLNHLLKSILVIALFFWLTKKYLKWQIYEQLGS